MCLTTIAVTVTTEAAIALGRNQRIREVLLVIIMTADSAASADTTATPAATTVDTVTPAAIPGTAAIGAITAVITSAAVLTGTADAQSGNLHH